MRFASFAALATAFAVFAASVSASAKDYEHKRTRIIIQKRSYLDAGTTVKPGTARYTNYLWAIDNRFPTYGPPNENINPRTPLPGPFELPGYPNY
jgi:hypothetical protein